jgi:hypothetical protein
MADNTAQILFGVWKKEYKEHYGKNYVGSVYRDANMLKRVASEVGEATLFDLIKYYFETSTFPEFQYFIFNYDKVMAQKELRDEDRVRRKAIRDRTRLRMAELNVPVGFSEPVDLPAPVEAEESAKAHRLVCEECGQAWFRPKQRGRPPKKCDECKGKK